jgi:transposase
LKPRREPGNSSVRPIPGRPSKKFAPLQAGLGAQLQAYPDATLEMHCRIWEQEHGWGVSPTTMGRAIRRIGWTRNKRQWVPTSRNEEARAAWRDHLKQLDARQLVVIDECGANIALTPLYARAPKGLRAYGSAPRNRGKNTTLIAALTFEGMGESMIIEGAANAAAFERSVEEILAPSLSAGQIVIMDNLAAPKGKKVEELIQARGGQLLFLPASSPDFSPIEETFSKVKTFLRRVGARTREALQEAICQALLTVTAQDAHGWFRHCGYLPAKEEG